MDFAPYQSSPPEHNRPFSPSNDSFNNNNNTTTSPRASLDNRRPYSPQHQNPWGGARSPPPLQHPQPQRGWQQQQQQQQHQQRDIRSPVTFPGQFMGDDAVGGDGSGGYGYASESLAGRQRDGTMSEFDTSLGIRLDYEAALAYLALPPLGAIVLLILERQSDYVRFHAWQSSVLFTAVFIVHLLFSWSTFLSWVIFLADLGLMGYMALRAYRDADTLDRFEIPVFGQIASRILDDE